MCIFCKIVDGSIPSYKLYEDDQTVVFLDISQATKGHALVVSKQHRDTLLDCEEELACHMMKVTRNMAKRIITKTNANGFNVLNNGNEVAGQTVMHAHIHIIPRYEENDGVHFQFDENTQKPDLDALTKLLTE